MAWGLQAQEGYRLDFKVEGLKDTTVYLGHYYGESTYVKDTARVDQKGNFKFSKPRKLEPGFYFLVLNRNRLFDFLIGENQTITFETKKDDYIPSLKIKGDLNNTLYLRNLLFNAEMNKAAQPWVAQMNDSTTSEGARTEAREELNKINDKVMAFQNEIISQHPDLMISKILKANQTLKVPEPPLLESGRPDSTFAYRYYREHFWDHLDLSDDMYIRMPNNLYRNKVNEYLDKMFMPHPDTITQAINEMVSVAKKNPETYKYLVWTVTIKYQQPEIMGLDEVFVNIYDQYFATGEMDFWTNATLKKNLKERAVQLRKSLIGKTAANLIMQDENLNKKELYQIKNKYTVIYFYDPDCGFCKKETPRLKSFYENTKFDVEVFAVCADTSMAKMKKYIKEEKLDWVNVNGPRSYKGHYKEDYDALTTPTIFVLDEKKKIIAKKLGAERLEEFLSSHEKMLARKEEGTP